MNDADLCLLSIEDLANEIREKRVSPVDATRAVLAQIERLQPQLNAFITVTAEQALADAREAEREVAAGQYRGPLHGVPIALKDLYATKGVRTTAGSTILADWIPGEDAHVVTNLRDAGAIFVGKLNMHEWAFGTSSDNPHFGAVRNPWNPECVPGGSSGGSAVATATGMAYATLGSDTGGSIRIPASECGCVGLMPTYGRVSLRHVVPLSWSLDHAGPLTRTVRDAAIMLRAIAGHDPLDPTTERQPVPDLLNDIERGPNGLRIGVPRNHFWNNLDPEIHALVRSAIDALEGAGAHVIDTEFANAERYTSSTGPIILVEAFAYHAKRYGERKSDYGIGPLLDAGAGVTATAYANAVRVMQQARAGEADAALDGVDILAVPTMPAPPPTIAEVRDPLYDVRRTVFTSLLDLTGQPVITVPCGLTSTGLPTGISFVARRWDELSALRAARAYEIVRGPFPTPPVSAH